MNTRFQLKTSLLLLGLISLPAAYALPPSKADQDATKARISADYKADKTACAALANNAKDICMEEAKAKEKVALAELGYSISGSAADMRKVTVAKAETSYSVAKEKCDDLAGNAKSVCVEEAKAAKTKALADVTLSKKVGEARSDASADKTDADYKVATEKCAALAGDAKASCVAAAKAKYGKT